MSATEINYKRIKAVNKQVTQINSGNLATTVHLRLFYVCSQTYYALPYLTNKITKKQNSKQN